MKIGIIALFIALLLPITKSSRFSTIGSSCPDTVLLETTEANCVGIENTENKESPSRGVVSGGNLASGYKTGRFTPSNFAYQYTLATTGDNSAYGIMINASHDVSIKVFYTDTDISHPFIESINNVPFLLTFPSRTAVVYVTPASLFDTNFNFSILATELTNFSGDYLRYDLVSRSLSLCTFSVITSSTTIAPSASFSIDSTNLGPLTDGFRTVLSASASPHSSVAQISGSHYFSSGSSSGVGSGFRIKPNYFGTCAHNLFSWVSHSFVYSASLYVGRTGGSTYLDCLPVTSFSIPINYFFNETDANHDYAVVETQTDSSNDYLGLAGILSMSLDSNNSCYLLGHPYGYPEQRFSNGSLSSISLTNNQGYSFAPSAGGSSGSPVFVNNSVVGIHGGRCGADYVYEMFTLFDYTYQSLVCSLLI